MAPDKSKKEPQSQPQPQPQLSDISLMLGGMQTGIEYLKGQVDDSNKQLRALNHSTVKRDDCSQRHRQTDLAVQQSESRTENRVVTLQVSMDKRLTGIERGVNELKGDVRKVLRRSSENNPISPIGSREISVPDVMAKPRGIQWWLGVLGGIIGILIFTGSVLYYATKAGRYQERVEQALKIIEKQSKRKTVKSSKALVPAKKKGAGLRPYM